MHIYFLLLIFVLTSTGSQANALVETRSKTKLTHASEENKHQLRYFEGSKELFNQFSDAFVTTLLENTTVDFFDISCAHLQNYRVTIDLSETETTLEDAVLFDSFINSDEGFNYCNAIFLDYFGIKKLHYKDTNYNNKYVRLEDFRYLPHNYKFSIVVTTNFPIH